MSAPHRSEAFEAARFGIDTLKATAPIWKKETWGADDAGWAVGAQGIRDMAEMTAAELTAAEGPGPTQVS